MTNFNSFRLLAGTKSKTAKRVGRGLSAGGGKTAGRGTKGQGSRTGFGRKVADWFEGGQTPLYRRLAKKRGFSRVRTKPITLSTTVINRLYHDGEVVSPETLIAKRFIRPRQARATIKLVTGLPLAVQVRFDGLITTKSSQVAEPETTAKGKKKVDSSVSGVSKSGVNAEDLKTDLAQS